MKLRTSKEIYEPREDSILLQKVIESYCKNIKPTKVLDIGTGTGIQAITSALNGAKKVVAVDINPKAVSLAKENAKLNKVKIDIFQSDLFSNIKGKFDLIIFNAPYLPKGVPEDPQWSGGKELIERFLKEAKKHLSKGGKILYVFSSLTGLKEANVIALETMPDKEVIYVAEVTH